MSHWQTYADFAHLFDALLRANGIGPVLFATQYKQTTGAYISHTKAERIQTGFIQPPYQFISDIADHALLSLDPNRVGPASDAIPPGDHRVALFAAAGLIEVTPDSIAHWNQEVFARWQRPPTQGRMGVAWQDLMKKLVEFHLQGGRAQFSDIANAANAHIDPDHRLSRARVNKLLNGSGAPTDQERLALATAVSLSPGQIQLIEDALKTGTLLLTPRHAQKRTRSAFSVHLEDLLDRLRAVDISQAQLTLRCVGPGQSKPSISGPTLSDWKNGHVEPTAASLRGLVHGLERYAPVVTSQDIDQLVTLAGFSMPDLFATSHDIIAGIGNHTRLKALLAAIRNAPDIEVTTPAVADHVETPDPLRTRHVQTMLKNWEIEACPNYPSQSDLMDLLDAYNAILRDKGLPELNPEEIRKVMEVADRDREEGLQRGFMQRARDHKPPVPRRRITPDFDSGPTRG
jgi:hypothetical protein